MSMESGSLWSLDLAQESRPVPTSLNPPKRLPGLQFLDLSYVDVASNLALDEALLVAAEERDAGPVLRVWESPVLAVVLGASGRLHEDVDVSRCHDEGIVIARRSSGGGTVMIGPGALNVSVVLPVHAAPGLAAVDKAQHFVLERIAEAFRRTGLPVEIHGSGDLTLHGRKFSGSAQRRLRNHFLVHASLLYRFPIDVIVRCTRLPKRQPAYRNLRSHEAFLTNLDLSREALLKAVKSAWLDDAAAMVPAIPEDLVHQLVAEKFGQSSWVERL